MRWAVRHLSDLLSNGRLRLLAKQRVAPRLLAAAISARHEPLLAMIRDISLLERFTASLNLAVDWDEL